MEATPTAASEPTRYEEILAGRNIPQPEGTPGKRLTILSLDGGGVRGIIPAVCLEYLESQLQAIDGPEARIADYFDVVAGTSTGGLIAAMLTAPDAKDRPMFTAQRVKQFYIDNAKTVFPTRGLGSGICGLFGPIVSLICNCFGPKYTAEPLRELLDELFKNLKMTDAVTDVLITSFDVKTLQPVFFTKQVAQKCSRFDASYVDVCLGTSAAPTFLPPHQFEVPDTDKPDGKPYQYNLVDGGIATNNPAEVALLHVVKDLTMGESPYKGRIPSFTGCKDLLLLFIGTGDQPISYNAKDMARWGLVNWAVPIIIMFENSSGYLVDYHASIRFQIDEDEENYLRLETHEIEGDMGQIDNASEENMKALENVANKLLDAKATHRDAVNGELVEKPDSRTNREALSCFAVWLSNEKAKRLGNPTSPPGPSPETKPRTDIFV